MAYTQEEISQIVRKQREFFRTGKTLDVNFRLDALKKLRRAVVENEQMLEDALSEDLGRSKTEAYLCDLGPTIAEINETIKGLKKWAKPEKHYSGILCFPSVSTRVYKMPYGVSLVISPFNFPVLLSLGVLTASIAGGNTTVLKTSSKSVACTNALKELIKKTFPENYVTVIDGGHDVADMCLCERFDKIFYTGSPRVAKHIMAEASENLTPVALELGGENGNWCIVRKDADIKDTARKIAFFKLLNAGQICININQVAVAEEIAEEFNEALCREFVRQIGKKAEENEEYPKLVSASVYDKCERIAKEYEDRILFGGSGNREKLKFSPTVIYPVGADEEVVMHELFCPILPIVPYKDDEIDELLDVIGQREHPLALYLFTKDMGWANRVMASMQYGGGCINEVCLHLMVKGVPFGGTGHSGMGAYHGEWGFREFTHPSTVMMGKTVFNLSLREHPYTGMGGAIKMKLLKWLEK